MINFRPVFIKATTLSDTWWQLLYNIDKEGRKYLITKGSYEGQYRLAFDDVAGVITHPFVKPLAPIMPEGINIPAPTTQDDIEQYFVNYLMDGELATNEHYKYGTWIVGGNYKIPSLDLVYAQCSYTDDIVGVPNQINWIIEHFKKYGFGNEHCYLTVGYPESNFAYDIPYTNEQERGTSPCLRGLDFRVIEENYFECGCAQQLNTPIHEKCVICGKEMTSRKAHYLTTKVIYRSWDLYGGFPVNMGGFELLNQYVASELGINPGPLTFTCKSLHLYDFQLEPLKVWLRKE